MLNDSDHPVGSFAGHRAGITFIDSKADDRYILTNSKDQTIKLWDIRCFSSADTAEVSFFIFGFFSLFARATSSQFLMHLGIRRTFTFLVLILLLSFRT